MPKVYAEMTGDGYVNVFNGRSLKDSYSLDVLDLSPGVQHRVAEIRAVAEYYSRMSRAPAGRSPVWG